MIEVGSNELNQQFDDNADIQSVSDYLFLFQTFFDTSLDNIAVYGPVGQQVYANATLLNTLNIKKHAGVDYVDLKGQHAFEHYYEAINRTLTTGESCAILLNFQHDSLSRVIYDLVNLSAIKNQKNQVIGVIAVGRDLDFYQLQQNQKIEQREQYLRALMDTFPFIVWMKDKAGRFLATNHKFVEVVGAKHYKDLEGKTDFDLFPTGMAQGYVSDDNEILETGVPKSVNEQIKRASGEVYWAETYKSPVELDGEVIGTVGFSRDITEKQYLQSEITKQHNAYQSLVKNLPTTVIRYNLEGKRIFVNSRCHEAYGVDVPYELNKTPLELWSPYIVNMTGEAFMAELMEVMQFNVQKTLEIHSVHEETFVVHQVRIVPELDEMHQVCGALTIATDITEVAEYRRKIENMAFHDQLTGLPNRTLFSQKLSAAIDKAKADNSMFALMMIDLDQFKSINDTMGHAIGDKLLIDVAKRVSNNIEKHYACARLGGDEFIILVEPLMNRAQVEHMSNTLLNQIMQVYVIEGAEYFISASIGISYYPDDSVDMNDLLKYADSAMYYAKKNGRNRYQAYSPNLTESIQQRFNIETELRRAIENNEIYLEYQPIVDIASKQVMGLETLCRWNSRKLGVVSPIVFIQIAEETGMIVELGHWIMREAFRAARLINTQLKQPVSVSVNLSARQFFEIDLVYQVGHLLQEQQCNPAWIKFEITESLLLESNQQVLKALDAFNDLGIKISLDDFGTGQSALAYLSKFPIHQVKIDYSFVKEIANNANNALLVKAIIALTATLNKELVAEGVETTEQAALLASYNCKYAQGYLYSKSIGLEAVQAYLLLGEV
jgi:diguanylate cyclase (GGDEF)-like protein/PAS domain S-box-containing protein